VCCELLKVALVCAAALTLAGCPTLPKPFAHEGPVAENGLVEMPSVGAVRVVPPKLPPEMAQAMTDAAINALTAAGIPASSEALANAFVLQGEVIIEDPDASDGPVRIEWRLLEPSGKPIGKIEQRLAAARPEAVTPLEAAARSAANEVAAYFDRRAKFGTVDGATEAAQADGKTSLFFEGVTGAPGDGNESLARTLTFILRKSGAPLVESPERATHLLTGQVEAKPQANGMSELSVVWRLTDSGGKELGKVSQKNPVKSALIERRWGELAFAVSDAAADGVLDALASVSQPPARRPLAVPGK
jgi:hypothetical protein